MTEPDTDRIKSVRDKGEQLLDTAAGAAKTWRQWANALDQLAREMPDLPGGVVGVDEHGDTYNLDLCLPPVDGTVMRGRLNETRAQADAIAAAIGRGRHLAATALKETLAYLEATPPEPEHVGATEEYAAELHEMNVELHGGVK